MESISKAFNEAVKRLDLVTTRSPRFGWHAKSAGAVCRTQSGQSVWLRVQLAKSDDISEKLWRGNEAANAVVGVQKPIVLKSDEWQSEKFQVRAEVMTYTTCDAISDTLPLQKPVTLQPEWWRALRTSLEHLHRVETERVCIRQDLVTRRVRERFGPEARADV